MELRYLMSLMLLATYTCAAPTVQEATLSSSSSQSADLDTAASTLGRRSSVYQDGYLGYGSTGYGSRLGGAGYGATGYGLLDGYNNYQDYGYNRRYPGYNANGYGYNNPAGYGSSGYDGGYGGGYSGYGGNGGYGGYGGNGGLNSYYGYNQNYPSTYHLGYGYGSRTPVTGYGNIYSGGITPSLVTGYRGYSRR